MNAWFESFKADFILNFVQANRWKYLWDGLGRTLIEGLRTDLAAEQIRLLYVALTRAKERLYVLGTVSKLSEKLSVNIVMTSSIPVEEASATVNKYI